MSEDRSEPINVPHAGQAKKAVNEAISSVDVERVKAALGDLGKSIDPATMRTVATALLLHRDPASVKRALGQAGKNVDVDQLKSSLGLMAGSFDKAGLKQSASSLAHSVDVDAIKQKSGDAARTAGKLGESLLGRVKTKLNTKP